MAGTDLDAEELRRLLNEATTPAATRRLMTAIAVAEGRSTGEVADWFDLERTTVTEWLASFETESPEAVVARLERFGDPGREVTPTGRETESHVEYLRYDAVEKRGWSLDDDALFDRARTADLDRPAYGGFTVEGGQSVLDAAEAAGLDWPHACRGGACSNCAVLVYAGELSMPGNQILPDEALDRGARLTCVGTPVTDRVQVVYGVDRLEYLSEYRLRSPAE
jgi:ferredoxin